MDFEGAKVALFLGSRLLVYRRDDLSHIPFPDRWDLPGGGRDPGEGPFACVARETWEEFGLILPRHCVTFSVPHRRSDIGRVTWFFVAHLPPSLVARVHFGDEGQCWRTMSRRDFLRRPDAVPHLQALVRAHTP